MNERALGLALLSWFAFSALGCGDGAGTGRDSAASGGSSTASGAASSGGATAGGSTSGGSSSGGSTSGGSSSGASTNGGSTSGGSTNGGSTSGGSANGGSGGELPHNVLPCEELGEVGVWEKISPNDYTIHGFIEDPINSGSVYVGTGNVDNLWGANGVWKTTDCGSTWEKIATGTGSDLVNNGRQWAWLADPTQDGSVYAAAGYGSNGFYKSTDGGVSWSDVTPQGDGAPGFVGGPEQMDPEDPNHLLLTWHSACMEWDSGIGCFAESTDGGTSWTEHYREGDDWGPEVRVYLLHGGTWIVPSDGLWRTTNSGDSWTKVSDLTAGGHSSGAIYRSPTGTYYLGSGGGVLQSTDDGVTWSVGENTGSYVMGITGDGTTVYASKQGGIIQADEGSDTSWTAVDSPFGNISEGCFLSYNKDYDLLFASCHGGTAPNGTSGIWRIRMK